ncbi:MAG: hypothetical protein GY847_04610 [Proteobacteria bacterium]|nr:hypothetical protein [Pseudomonadota bacterium]
MRRRAGGEYSSGRESARGAGMRRPGFEYSVSSREARGPPDAEKAYLAPAEAD